MTRSVSSWRRLVGCITAYAVAFQLALSGLVIVSHVALAAQGSEICSHATAGGDPSGQPPGDPAACPCGPACTMPACAAMIGLPPAATAITLSVAATPPRALRFGGTLGLPRPMAERPQNPRAPPGPDALAA